MKVYKNFEEVTEILNAEKLSENAALVSRCGLEGEKIISDINNCKNEKLNYRTWNFYVLIIFIYSISYFIVLIGIIKISSETVSASEDRSIDINIEIDMRPLVYVKAIRSLFWENSCASGTTAVGAYYVNQYKESSVFLTAHEPGGILSVNSGSNGHIILCGNVSLWKSEVCSDSPCIGLAKLLKLLELCDLQLQYTMEQEIC